MRLLLLPCAMLALTGCATLQPPSDIPQQRDDDLVRTTIGHTVLVNGPAVTPVAILEDSRCPMNARCVWAGRVRVSVRIDLGSGSRTQELVQGEPIHVADGTLELVEVRPDAPATNEAPLQPDEYRFSFRFMGGI